MKLFISSLLFSLIFFSCSISEEPECIRIENILPKKVNLTTVEIISDAIFYNPNDIGCNLIDTNITVYINNQEVGVATQRKEVDIQSKGEFNIPLKVNFSPTQLINSKLDLLNGSLKKLLKNKVTIQYLGTVTLEKAGISFEVSIDKTDDIILIK